MASTAQRSLGLAGVDEARSGDSVVINARCRFQTSEGHRVVSACGVVIAHYTVGDAMAEAHAMVGLVEQGWAHQNEIAAAFKVSERTVRRHQRRFEEGGLSSLGRRSGYPRGRPRLAAKRGKLVNQWKAQGESNREIAQRLGVCEKAVRKQLRRLGWQPRQAEQLPLTGIESAGPNLSGRSSESSGAPAEAPAQNHERVPEHAPATADPNLSGSLIEASGSTASTPPQNDERVPERSQTVADPNLSDRSTEESDEPPPVSFDADPSDRQLDRVLATVGLLHDAAPLFRPGVRIPNAGVLLAIPALIDSGVIEIAHDVYGTIGPAFYGLRTTIVALLLMALMRIKRAEALKEHSPQDLGRLLGLDRAPEVKTLRRKLARLAAYGRGAEFGHALALRRVQARGHAMGFLYLDGHVRAYHGKREIPKGYVTRQRIAMPATTDYWLNDAEGEPLFVITSEANRQLVTMLPTVLDEVRTLVGERRVTVVFDRGGWSPKLFQQLIADGFDILTYRKGRVRRVPIKRFSTCAATIDGRSVSYMLADQEVRLLKQRLRLRQITRLCDDGQHQTTVITSRRDLPAVEVAYRMFERWRQENFFKYLRDEYALDALVDYGVEPADAARMVPNPEHRALGAKLRLAYAELNKLAAKYGVAALSNREQVRHTMRGFKIANAPLSKGISALLDRIAQLEKKRAHIPVRVPVQQVVEGEVVRLAVERKHLSNLLKMVAFQAESELVRLLAPHYRRAEEEGRTLITSALATAGDIDVTRDELRVALDPLSSPHRTAALRALCEHLDAKPTRFPGSNLRLRFNVKPEPPSSLAFPGSRP